jgi:hypothetical protein
MNVLINFSTLHHKEDPANGRDILQRIPVGSHQIGFVAGSYGADSIS